MGQEPRTGGAPVTATEDPAQIEREIEQTREALGDTVEALAQKTDVKAQARQRIEQTKASATEKKDELLAKVRDRAPDSASAAAAQTSAKARENKVPLAAAGVFAVGFLAGRMIKS